MPDQIGDHLILTFMLAGFENSTTTGQLMKSIPVSNQGKSMIISRSVN
jgi:hypothetical protein